MSIDIGPGLMRSRCLLTLLVNIVIQITIESLYFEAVSFASHLKANIELCVLCWIQIRIPMKKRGRRLKIAFNGGWRSNTAANPTKNMRVIRNIVSCRQISTGQVIRILVGRRYCGTLLEGFIGLYFKPVITKAGPQ